MSASLPVRDDVTKENELEEEHEEAEKQQKGVGEEWGKGGGVGREAISSNKIKQNALRKTRSQETRLGNIY